MGNLVWQQAAANAASGALGIGVQRLGANYDRQQQMKTQEGLMGIQLKGEKEMLDYQKMKDLQMWDATNYEAQMKHIKAAGLNPALMYGMGGGGGVSTGGSTPSVTGGSATNPETTTKGLMSGMGLMNLAQTRLMESQAKNLDANTAKTNAEIPNVSKTGANIDASTKSILQGITNQKAQKALTDAQAKVTNFQANILEETQDDQIKKWHADLNLALDNARIAMNEAKISSETVDSKINQLKAEAIGAALDNALTGKQIQKTGAEISAIDQGITESKARIKKMVTDMAQGWQELNIKMKVARVQAIVDEYEAQFKGNIGSWRFPDARTMARQIDQIMNISPDDFKKK